MLPTLLLLSLAQNPAPSASQIKVAVPAMQLVGLDEKLGEFYAGHLSQQLGYRGVGTVTTTEIAALLGLERQRQLLGCSDDSCKIDVMSTLGVDGVVVGRVTKLDKSYQLDVRILATSGPPRALAAASANTEDNDRLVAIFPVIAAQLANELAEKLGHKLEKGGGAEVVLRASTVKRRSWAPLVGGAVAFGVGTALLVLARGAHDELLTPRTPDQAQAYDDARVAAVIARGQLQQTLGWVAVGVGGACVVAAAVMFLLGGNDVVQAGVALTPDGGGFSVSGVWP